MDERNDLSPDDAVDTSHDEGTPETLVERVHALLDADDAEGALGILSGVHPVDQGEVLLELSSESQHSLVAALPPEDTAEILRHLEPGSAARIAAEIEAPELARILDETRPDVAADILRHIPKQQSQEALEGMRAPHEVAPLLAFEDETAGGLMTPEYPAIGATMNAALALDVLRMMGREAEAFTSIFVVDELRALVGTLSIIRLALARPDTQVTNLMDSQVVSVPAGTDQEECARLMERYDLDHLPVVDDERRIIGIIQLEDVVDVVEEEATEDLYRIAGMPGEQTKGSVANSVRRRLPWLTINLATAFLAGLVISLFESTIARIASLAVFLPIIAGQGGIGGTQTLTLVVRRMALGQLGGRRGLPMLGKELLLGLVHGLLLGVVVGLVAYAWKGSWVLGIVVGVAMFGNMLVAGLAGAGVPLLLRRLKWDPAVSAAVFVTTFTDVVGFLLFLGLAAALVQYLL